MAAQGKSDPVEFSEQSLCNKITLVIPHIAGGNPYFQFAVLASFWSLPLRWLAKLGTSKWIYVLMNCTETKFWFFSLEGFSFPGKNSKAGWFSVHLAQTLQCTGCICGYSCYLVQYTPKRWLFRVVLLSNYWSQNLANIPKHLNQHSVLWPNIYAINSIYLVAA